MRGAGDFAGRHLRDRRLRTGPVKIRYERAFAQLHVAVTANAVTWSFSRGHHNLSATRSKPSPENLGPVIGRRAASTVEIHSMPRGGPDASWLDRRLQTDGLEYTDRYDVSDETKQYVVTALEAMGTRNGTHETIAGYVVKLLAGIDTPRILELGAGHGRLSEQILRPHPTAELTSPTWTRFRCTTSPAVHSGATRGREPRSLTLPTSTILTTATTWWFSPMPFITCRLSLAALGRSQGNRRGHSRRYGFSHRGHHAVAISGSAAGARMYLPQHRGAGATAWPPHARSCMKHSSAICVPTAPRPLPRWERRRTRRCTLSSCRRPSFGRAPGRSSSDGQSEGWRRQRGRASHAAEPSPAGNSVACTSPWGLAPM